MSMTRRCFIALLIAAALSIGAAATLSDGEAPTADEAKSEKTRNSEMLRPTQDAPTPPSWLVSDFSWM